MTIQCTLWHFDIYRNLLKSNWKLLSHRCDIDEIYQLLSPHILLYNIIFFPLVTVIRRRTECHFISAHKSSDLRAKNHKNCLSIIIFFSPNKNAINLFARYQRWHIVLALNTTNTRPSRNCLPCTLALSTSMTLYYFDFYHYLLL